MILNICFILFLLSACTTSVVKNSDSVGFRSPTSQSKELKLKTKTVDLDIYDLATDDEAKKSLNSILASSKTAFIKDFYQEDREARLYRTFNEVQKAARVDSKHLANNLSREELVAVINYSHDGFEPMNKALWTGDFGKAPQEIEYQILGLFSALQNLAKFEGEVLRGEFGKQEQVNNIKAIKARFDSFEENKLFVLPSFWSTTRGESVTARGHYINYSPLVYKIQSLSGRRVESLSLHDDEEEVLFSPLTKFKLISKQKVQREEATSKQYPYNFHYEIKLQEI